VGRALSSLDWPPLEQDVVATIRLTMSHEFETVPVYAFLWECQAKELNTTF